MATVRAQRLLNSVLSGATDANALQARLGTASNLSDWQQAVNERGKAKMIVNSSAGAAATFSSALALTEFLDSSSAVNELSQSNVGLDAFLQYATTTLSSSTDATKAGFSSPAAQALLRRDYRFGVPLMLAPEAVNQTPALVGTSTWRLPLFQTNTWGSVQEADWNGATILMLYPSAFNNSTVLRVSTNNGLSFSTGSIAADSNAARSIAFGNGLWVVVGDAGKIYTSTSGMPGTWTARTSGTTNVLRRVRYANGRFVAVGVGVAVYSTDGITWTVGSGMGLSGDISGLEFLGSNTWMTVTNNSGTPYKSTDNGATWSAAAAMGYTNSYSIGYGNGTVVVGHGSGYTWSKNAGSSWTYVATGISAYGVAYWGGVWLFGSSNTSFGLASFDPSSGAYFSLDPALVPDAPVLTSLQTFGTMHNRRGRLFVLLASNGGMNSIAWKSA